MSENAVLNSVIRAIQDKKKKVEKLLDSLDRQEYEKATEELIKAKTDLYNMWDFASNKENMRTDVFINAVKYKSLSDNDKKIILCLAERSNGDGGLLVPADIQTEVKALRNDGTNLEAFVNVEPVTKNEGSRLVEIRADETALADVEEGDPIPEIDNSKILEVKYKVKKRAGVIKVTNELLSDTNKAVLKWIKTWLAKKTRATRNKAIIDKINSVTEGKEVTISNAKDLKEVVYKKLESYNDSLIVVTNSSGFDYLDNLVDENGNKVLETDTASRQKLLFGLYPVKKLSDKVLKNKAILKEDGVTVGSYKYPLICGDLKEAITLFDRENLSIDLAENGEAYFTDNTKIKVRDRIDVQAVDKDAIIKAEVQVFI